MKKALVIVGSPGVGKSSVSSLLATHLKGRYINVGDLVKREGFDRGLDKKRGTLIADVERVSKSIAKIIEEFEGYVIVEGHFAMDVVRAEDILFAFVLRRSPDELREVLKKRKYTKEKIAENVSAEILDVCLFDAVQAYPESRVHEIDVSGKKAEHVVSEITDVVQGHREPRRRIVDWLMQLELKGRLDEFLESI
ncbi:MAG: adenylate kinase family protein [Candidatus Bathyarchaeota archaeon]|nr:adenylate kinase family protein [Candidatus Bathyarchaeota archaeon]